MTDNQVEFAKQFLHRDILSDDVKASTRQEHESVAKALPQAAIKPDTNDFDVLLMLAAHLLYQNERLPEWLTVFAADVLSGKRKRPTKRGADKYANWERDYKLWRTTEEVAKKFHLPRYSNNELSPKTTAAEIVSRAANCNADVVTTAYRKFNRKFNRTTGAK